jgi:hypothetical protein
MPKLIRQPAALAAFVLAALAATPSGAIDPGNLNLITFQNRTGGDIRYIFLSPGDSDYWGTDILGANRLLADDEDVGFYIHYPERCNEFDIFAVGQEEAFLVYGYEICDDEEAEVRLTRRNLDDEAPEFTFTTVTLANATDEEIWYLFFSPGDSDMWGVDQLDQATILAPGEALSVLLPIGESAVRYDVQAVDGKADSYTFYVEIEPGVDEFQFEIAPGDRDGGPDSGVASPPIARLGPPSLPPG